MDYALIIYTCTYNHMCIIPETQMTHILEDLTYKMGQVNPPKKEVSWVLGIPWKTNMEPENGPLGRGDSSFGNHHFQVPW